MSVEGKEQTHLNAAAAARNRANMYSFLATLLNRRPDSALVFSLKTAGGDFISSLAEQASLTGLAAEGFRDIAKYVDENKGQPEKEIEQELAVDWTRLFRGLSPAYSPMPPYEAAFTETPGNELVLIQRVNNFYRAHGLLVDDGTNERPDYIGLELSFLEYLADAEAEAWEAGNADLAKSYQNTARVFLKEHLSTWADKFLEPAMGFAKTSFYYGFLKLCRGVVAEAAA